MTESDPNETQVERTERPRRDGARCSPWLDDIEDGCGCVEVWERLSERRTDR